MNSSPSTKFTLKLLIDTNNEKVLFAEVSKPVVDFIFNILSLPVGVAVKLIGNNDMVGSIGNLYQSVENLNHNCMQQDVDKDVLLNPSAPRWSIEIAHRLPPQEEEPLKTLNATSAVVLDDELDKEDREEYDDYDMDEDEDEEEEEETEESDEDSLAGETMFYMCPNECSYDVTCDKTTRCCSCKRAMTNNINYVGKNVDEEYISIKNGFVKEAVNFIVTDDLVIQPMQTLSGITLLNKFNIKEIGALKEMVVELGVDEGIKLLKASMQSKMVLTSVFLNKEY